MCLNPTKYVVWGSLNVPIKILIYFSLTISLSSVTRKTCLCSSFFLKSHSRLSAKSVTICRNFVTDGSFSLYASKNSFMSSECNLLSGIFNRVNNVTILSGKHIILNKGYRHLISSGRVSHIQIKQLSVKKFTMGVLKLEREGSLMNVGYYINNVPHDHSGISHGINVEIKSAIKDIYNEGYTKSKEIGHILRARNIEVPESRKISNYLNQLKLDKYGPCNININNVITYCESRKSVSFNFDTVYIVNYVVNEKQIRIFFTTKRLLITVSDEIYIQVNATYKLIWQGYSVLVAGTSDMNRRFHPVGLAVTTEEKTEDYEFLFKSIKLGCFNWTLQKNSIFSSLMQVMLVLSNQDRLNIRLDIGLLQICYLKSLFTLAKRLFIEKLLNVWSSERKNGFYKRLPTFNTKIWTKAYKWHPVLRSKYEPYAITCDYTLDDFSHIEK
ncbi:hypothetical protein A3Q56_06535 [Intoshia linei]|uniref:Uncharacterized protein n=1 Tax=Intoshia linei TaxID=1819745 RepID=A0A177AV55_9BILA|nr:hypothetical protein A3Q56_06535 [Intoshia linei]